MGLFSLISSELRSDVVPGTHTIQNCLRTWHLLRPLNKKVPVVK